MKYLFLVVLVAALMLPFSYSESNAQFWEGSTEKKEESKETEQNPDGTTGWGDEWQGEKISKEDFPYYRPAFDTTFKDVDFQTVWNSIIEVCEAEKIYFITKKTKQDDEGLYKGIIKSDYFIFVDGADNTYEVIKKYSFKDLPFIRGGEWQNGRVQYKMILTENSDGTVFLDVKCEISGYESLVTEEVAYWSSSGYFETKILEKIGAKVASKM
jgi:hypothetical protein